jgi:uncharacterized protein DUF3738
MVSFCGRAQSAGTGAQCGTAGLPKQVQQVIAQRFPAWKIQGSSDLSSAARSDWRSRRPLACPGIARGRFASKRAAYALLLVPVDNPNAAYRFVVFDSSGQPDKEQVIEQSDSPGAANYFIRKVPIRSIFSIEWIQRLKIEAPDGILLVDSAATEYETDVYFYAGGHSMERIASTVAGQLNAPVVDATGAKGNYDVSLQWISGALRTSGVAGPESGRLVDPESDAGPALPQALQEQLGLKLQAVPSFVTTPLTAKHFGGKLSMAPALANCCGPAPR